MSYYNIKSYRMNYKIILPSAKKGDEEQRTFLQSTLSVFLRSLSEEFGPETIEFIVINQLHSLI